MIFDREFKEYGYTDLIAFSGKDISEEMLLDCKKIYQNFYSAEFANNFDALKAVILKHSQMCFVVKDTVKNVVVGFSFWFPIKTKIFNQFIATKKPLLNFEENYFSSFNDKTVNLFLASEAYILGYDIKTLHNSIEDIFSRRVLDLAYKNTKIKYIAIESKCSFDEKILVKLLSLKQFVKKQNTTFYFDEYKPEKVYKGSKYAQGIKQYYAMLDENNEDNL